MVTIFTLAAIVIAVFLFTRLSGNPRGHSPEFLRRRAFNWLPLGLTYALLYMGRYNLTVAKIAFGDLMDKSDFGLIFAVGTITYAAAFIINGPLTDRIGGRKAMLISAGGAGFANLLMGLFTYLRPDIDLTTAFVVLYAINMYFQSFGAVSIVKVNSAWFHVHERGMFGGIFGILISAGIFFAFQVGQVIVDGLHTIYGVDHQVISVSPPYWVFLIPSLLLFAFTLIDYFIVQDRPSGAGLRDIETGDASSGESETPDPLRVVLKRILTNPIVLTIAAIEFCTGVLRQGIMHWYPILSKDLGYYHDFVVTSNWGAMLFLAGATGGMTAGWISDKIFGSRRGPVAALLYAIMIACVIVMAFAIPNPWVLGVCVVLISYCVIGTHGMLSGTASMDFGGRKNVGTAVALIDGMVYLGTSLQAYGIGRLTESDWGWDFGGYLTRAHEVGGEAPGTGWSLWPLFLLPFAILGTILAIRIWRAIPEAARKR